MKNVISKEEAERICKSVFNVADFCRAVGWKPQGSNYLTFPTGRIGYIFQVLN